MESSARLVTIKRSGDDGAHFPLSLSSCLFGRSIECDIRIQLPVVSKKHCKIEVNEQQAILYNFSSTNPTQVNGATIDEPVQLKHGDIITIIDRSFRYENGNHEDGSRSAGFPGRSSGQQKYKKQQKSPICREPARKDQDAKASKTTASRRSLVHAKRLPGDNSASDGSKDSVIQDPLNTEQHCSSNICEPTSGDLIKKSRATGNSYRELKSSPALSLCNSKKNESPFKNLYQSMKEELDIKSQKQSRRKSEPQPECVAGKDTWETKLLACKSRPKSSGSTPGTATSSPRVEKMGTEKKSSGVGPVETSTEALSSSFSPSETAKVKTPVRNSQQLKNEDLLVIGKRDPVILNESEGAQVVHKIVTPRKLGTRNQTAVKVEDAASPGGTPENISSKKRRRISAEVEALPAETQSRFSSTQPLTPGEKKTPKDSFSKSEKVATATEQICSGLPGLSSVDISNFGRCSDKSEGMSLKRRRVSFGGHLRPELFDENLPPNTPLKRGETPTKRKSLTTHTPAVLKKIIKEWRQSPGKHESPGITPPRASDQRCKSDKSSSAFSGSESLHQTDIPKKAGRKSGNLPAKRASISRSQHDILQMICSKRRSGASEANLIVAKSWADVVKLGTKQTQTKVVKHIPQKQMSKRQRRPNTPKKPASNLPNQFSTGHANSPCTIVIGRAQIEKVSMPARPYKMLNNLVLNRKMDFSEDLSGLTEMFKTPGKEKQQQMDDMNLILSTSDNLPEKQFQVTKSGGKPLPITSEILGENVLSSTQNASKEPSDIYFASPTLRRKSIKNGNTGQTPKNIHNTNPLEKKTPGSVTEPLKTVSSVSKLRRSRELIHTLVESMNENTEADHAEGIKQRHLRKTSLERQEVDQEKTSTMRSSAREQKPTKDLIGGIQMVTQTLANAEELLNQSQEKGITEKPKESEHIQNTPIGDGHRATKQKVDRVYASKEKHWPRTPDQKTQTLEGPVGLKEPFETPNCREKLTDKTKVFCKSAQPTTENMKTSKKEWSGLSGSKVDVKKEDSFGRKFVHTSGGTRHTPKVSKLEHGNIRALKESENQMLDLTVTGSKRTVGKANEKTQPLDNLASFQELFLSPGSSDKITKMPNKSTCSELVRTPASTKRLSKTGPGKVDEKEVHSTLGKRTKSPGRATRTPTAPLLEEHDNTAFMETPKQKLDFTGNSTGHKRRSRTSKIRAEPLEDLDGFQELFQTPAGASDPVTVEETTEVSLECPQPEAVRTPASTKRLSKTGLVKVDEKEVHSALGKRTKSPGRATCTSIAPLLEEHDNTAFMETPKQKLDFTGNSTGHKRRSRTSKIRAELLEDLDGFQELFQTPAGASDPVTVEETTEVSLECPQPEAVRTPASTKRLLRMGLSAEKGSKSVGRISSTPTALVQKDNGSTVFMETPEQKLVFTGNSTGHKKRSRTPKIRAPPLDDLDGFQELFQTPAGASVPVTVEETTEVPLECPQPELVRTPASMQRLSRTSLGKVNVREELLKLEKRTKSPGRAAGTATVQQKKRIKATMETSNQKLESEGNLTGPKKHPRIPKEESQSLEDLAGCQELLQTPDHGNGPMVVGKTKNMSFNSLQLEPTITLKSIKRQSKASVGKMEVNEELLETEKHLQIEKDIDILLVSNDNNAIRASKQAAKRKLDPAASMPRSKRLRRTSRANTPDLEDMSSFQQLFQTPGHAKDSLNIGETLKIPTKSPQSGPVRSQTSRKSLPKVTLRRMDVSEELSTLWKQSPDKASTVPGQQDNRIQTIMKTPEKKLETAANITGLTGQQRAPKEDLNGFQELFQTPDHSTDALIGNKRKSMSLKSPQPGLVRTPQTSKRLAKTSLGKVSVREEISLNMPGHATGEIVHIPRLLEDDVRGNKGLKDSITQTLGPSVCVTGSKKQRRPHKERSQSPEGLCGLQELFQTPASHKDSMTVCQTTKMSLESSEPEAVRTPASTKRLSKTSLVKVDEKEVHSTLGKRAKSPRRATRTPTAPLLEEHDNTAFMETPKQKLDFTGNSTGHKRRSRTPKIRAEPLEDLDGFQELFQTPAGASDPVTVGVTAEVPLECPQPEAVRTPVSTKRLSKTGLGKVDIREKLSPLNKLRCSAPEVGHASRLSDNGRGTKDLMEPAAQTSDPAVRITRSKRNQGTCKKSSLASEDLFCLQEPFKTSGHDKDSGASDKLTEMPHRSSPPEPVDASETSERQLRTRRMKIHVKNELSGDRMLPKMLKEIMDISGVPEVEDKGIRTRKQSVKRKLDTAVSMSKSKRQRVARAENAQTLMDLPGFQELYQTPSLAVDSVNVDITTKMPSKSPEPMDTISETQPGRRLRRVGVTKEPIAQRQSTRVLRETRNTRKEPMNNSKGIKDFKEFSVPKEDPAGSLTGKRSQSRALKKTQPLEELPSIQEETATRISCESPQPEEKETSAASKRQLKIQLCKVGIKEEPTAQRKPPGRATRNTLKEPMSDSADVEELKESKKQKIDPAASVPVSKRPQRVPREKAQPLELAGLKEPVQIPGHTEELASNKRSTQMPCKPLQPEQVHSLQTSPRCLRTRRGKVEVSEEPSVVRETVPTLRQTTRSRKVHETDDKDTQASKEPAKQKLEKVANETGSRRQLRALKDEVPPLEVLGDSKKLAQISVHTEKLGHDTSNLKSTLQQMPDSTKPLRTCRRVLRASKEDTVETMELPVNIREPVESQSKSNTVVSPKRKSARDKSISRARGLRSVTAKQEESDEKPAPKKQKAVSSKMHMSPEPLKMKHLRIMSSKIEPLEEQISNIIKTEEKEVQVENSAPADQKMGLSSRYRKKTNGRQPRPEVGVSAETVQIKKNEMTMKTSQETELQNTDDGTKKSTSKGKVSGKRTCLRSRGQSEIPQPQAAEEKTSETNAEILIKTQKEKEISEDSDVRCLRSRKTGATLDSEPKPRVTRGAKKDTKVPKKDEDIVYTKKLRTRSHQNSKNM
ncbi:proliferation marker Ki-67 [Sigmodon hispidus]